ncbi:lipopolysaccharide biosynthesis protein [Pseudorhodoferax sp. Leaf265]|uniref:lipopolysaccharide biosynthesis protein n=1 Tax=Pseudorhodoferax sp. Leaf265 TaxID=1736315 RepID=UPI0009E78993|nr:lipopolysaccharide biosynthesis protein [Pseudorhodoferax sp. Leaf265]
MNSENRLSTKAAKSIAWVALEKWASRLLSLFVFILLGRLLAPADFGLAALALSISTVLAVFVENGMAQALVQRDSIEEDDTHSAFWTCIGVATTIYFLLVIASPLLALAFKQPSLTKIVPISGLVLILSALSSVPAALLEREMKFANLTARQLIGSIVGAVVAITAAFHGAGVWALVILPVVSSGTGTIVLWRATKWRPRFRFSPSSARKLGGFGAQVIAIDFLNVMQSNLDKFIIGAQFSASTLGYYFVAQRILTIVMDMLSTTFAKVSLTTFSRLQGDPTRMMRYFLILTFAGCAVATPIFLTLGAFGNEVMHLFFGDRWRESVPLLMLMVPSALLASVTVFDKNLLLARGRGMASIKLACYQLAFGTILLVIAVPYGIHAMAAARSIRQITFWPVRIQALKKHASLPIRQYLLQFMPPSVGALFFLGVAYALKSMEWFQSSSLSPVYFIPALLLCFGMYIIVVFFMARSKVVQVLDVIRTIRFSKAPAKTGGSK